MKRVFLLSYINCHEKVYHNLMQITSADWDSNGRVITQIYSRAFETVGRAFSFALNPQKLGRVF